MTNWQTKKLGDAMEFIPTGSHSRNDMMSGLSADKNAVFNIHYGDIHTKYTTYVDFDKDIVPILKENSVRSSMELQDGDLVVADASEDYAGVGSAVELRNVSEKKVIGGLHTFALRSKNDEFASGFTGLILKNPATHKRLMQMSVYSKVYGLTKSSIASVDVSYPEKPEQERIVGVLEVWDEYIEKLEQKIALKEQLKKGLMQQLLTGNRRLPGFSGEWRNVKLGELGNIIRGVSYNPKEDLLEIDTDSSVRLLRSNNVQKREIILNDVQIVGRTKVRNDQLLQDNDIVVCMANGSKRLVGKSALFNRSDGFLYTVGAFMAVYRRNESTASLLAEYLFATSRYEYYIASTLSGSSINNLKGSDIESMDFRVPFDDEEALAISGVLDTCQDEISKLMLKRRRIIEQKKYLLKNLITGTIRTPEDLKPLDTTRLERSAL